jgi:hypothetical protein
MEGAYSCGLKMEMKMAPGAPFSLFFCPMEKTQNNKGPRSSWIPTSAKALYEGGDISTERSKRSSPAQMRRLPQPINAAVLFLPGINAGIMREIRQTADAAPRMKWKMMEITANISKM